MTKDEAEQQRAKVVGMLRGAADSLDVGDAALRRSADRVIGKLAIACQLLEALPALSSPCAYGGRELIWEIDTEGHLSDGSFGPLEYHVRFDIPRGKHRVAVLPCHVLVFADEPQGEAND